MWWSDLESEIERICLDKLRRHKRNLQLRERENRRRTERSIGSPAVLQLEPPVAWGLDREHDPQHVLRRKAVIAHAIQKSLLSGGYAPHSPLTHTMVKPTGGERTISAFAIADEAVSRRVYRSILDKNRGRLGGRAYAYRDDIGAYDALAYVQSSWSAEHRVFVASFDFKNYFDSIDHDFLWSSIKRLGLVITPMERRVAASFLNAGPRGATTREGVGIPLGTSISLILANIAAAPLDRAFERAGVSHVRYADDTLLWSPDYSAICRAVEQMYKIAEQMGAPISNEKSDGIVLLVAPGTRQAEVRCQTGVDFLSHRLGLRSTKLKPAAEIRLQNDVRRLVYDNLLREPQQGTQALSRVAVNDRDYIRLIWQMRRLIYGHLTENDVVRLGRGSVPSIPLSGAIARYPFVDDREFLKGLDAWILTETWLALRKRASILRPLVIPGLAPRLWEMSRDELLHAKTTSTRTGRRLICASLAHLGCPR